MLLYNVTVTIDLQVSEDWAHWMRETHIPDVMATGMFVSYRMCRLLNHEHTDAEIYTIQYMLQDWLHLERYQAEFAPELQRLHRDRYGDSVAAFRTVMEIVQHNENYA